MTAITTSGAFRLKERVSNPDYLLAAIREVAQGGSVIDPKVVEALVGQRTRAAHSPLADLTLREREVLASMARGRPMRPSPRRWC